MAASALTVTPPSPSPPTNFACNGVTGPNPPNFTKTQYANPFNLTAFGSVAGAGSGGAGIIASGAGGTTVNADGRPQSPYGVNPNPPPYTSGLQTPGTVLAFIAPTGALASGTAATSGGTEGTYPGTGTMPAAPFGLGAVPASTSATHEGAGQETVTTKTVGAVNDFGSDPKKYGPLVFVPGLTSTYLPTGQTPAWAIGNPGGPFMIIEAPGGATAFNGVDKSPNASHASSLSPLVNPTISATPATTLSPTSVASGTNTFALTVTGVGFTRQSVVYINGVPQTTVYVSSTSLTVANALKKTTAGTLPVNVVTGGSVVTANSANMTYS